MTENRRKYGKISDVWDEQERYNSIIKMEEGQDDPGYWTQTYLLGMVAEVDEVLQHIQWKRHRKKAGKKPDLTNLGYELADLMKYMFSLWQAWGFTLDDMLKYVENKNFILRQMYKQDFITRPSGNILIMDIDGTLGDWRTTFTDWLWAMKNIKLSFEDPKTSLLLDTDFWLHYPEYIQYKEEFERNGGYRMIEPYSDAVEVVTKLCHKYDTYIIAVTARPIKEYHRIWVDTWNWLERWGIIPNELQFIGAERILLADELNSGGANIILFEDNPGLAKRAANSNIRVFARRHPYNESIKHRNITLLDKFTDIPLERYFSVAMGG